MVSETGKGKEKESLETILIDEGMILEVGRIGIVVIVMAIERGNLGDLMIVQVTEIGGEIQLLLKVSLSGIQIPPYRSLRQC